MIFKSNLLFLLTCYADFSCVYHPATVKSPVILKDVPGIPMQKENATQLSVVFIFAKPLPEYQSIYLK